MIRVRWERRALDALGNLWTQADAAQRQAITRAAHAIDLRLRKDPFNEGESRSRGRRVTFAPPLMVVFRIEPDGNTVSVLEVRLFRRRKP
jgi:hypothetical protein